MSLSKIDGIEDVLLPNGKTVQMLMRVPNRVKVKFERWLHLNARRALFDIAEELEDDAFQASLANIAEESAAGTFSWGGKAWLKAVRPPPGVHSPGIMHMVMLLMQEAGEKLTEAELLDMYFDPAQVMTKKVHEDGTETSEPSGITAAIVLTDSVIRTLRATPNFLSPPTRGTRES